MTRYPPFPMAIGLMALLLVGCATPGPGPEGYPSRNDTIPVDVRPTDFFPNPEAGFTAEIWSDQPPPRLGDYLSLKLRASADVYLSLYAIHSSGRTSRLLDNQTVRNGRTMSFPGPHSSVDFRLSPPPGTETYLLVATQRPLSWLAPADIRRRGSLTELNLTGDELLERLRAVLAKQNPYSWNVAALNQPVRP